MTIRITPGPWKLEEDNEKSGEAVSVQEGAEFGIGKIYGPEDFPCMTNEDPGYADFVVELEANQTAVLAVPEMLAALETFKNHAHAVNRMPDSEIAIPYGVYKMLLSAYEKATKLSQ